MQAATAHGSSGTSTLFTPASHPHSCRPAQEELRALPGYGSKSASNLLEAIQASRSRPAAVVLEALGVPGVGKAVARQLLQQLGSVAAVMRATQEELQAVRGGCLLLPAAACLPTLHSCISGGTRLATAGSHGGDTTHYVQVLVPMLACTGAPWW
jgi:hypothetical protein